MVLAGFPLKVSAEFCFAESFRGAITSLRPPNAIFAGRVGVYRLRRRVLLHATSAPAASTGP